MQCKKRTENPHLNNPYRVGVFQRNQNLDTAPFTKTENCSPGHRVSFSLGRG